jgi:polysaccharide biosynthesis transport protein
MSREHLSLNEAKKALQTAVHGETVNRPNSYPNASIGYVADSKDSESVVEYWRVLTQRRGALFLATLLGATTAILLTVVQTPVYRAQSLLEVQNLNEDFLNMRSVSPTANPTAMQSPEYNIRTQAMILQSRPVIERAIVRLNLQGKRSRSTSSDSGHTFNLRKLLHLPVSEALTPRELDLPQAQRNLKVVPEPSTRVLKLSFDSTDRGTAADFANLIADEFIQLSFETRSQTSRNTVEWLMLQMESLKTKLSSSEQELQRFAGSSNLTILSEKENVDDQRLRTLQAELSKAQTETIAKQSRYELASTAPSESLPEILDDTTLKEYQVELTALRRQLAELMSQYTSAHPKVQKLQDQISTLEAALAEKRNNILARIKNEFLDAQRRENLLTTNYNSQTGHMAKQADEITHYSILKREVDTTRALYDSMLQKVTEAGLASAMHASDIHVIEPATPPKFPFKPSFPLNTAFGLFTGFCLGVAFVIQRARSDRGIHEPGDTTLHLNLTELGVIPASGRDSYRILQSLNSRRGLQTLGINGSGVDRLELATWQQQFSVIAESFRLTLASILFSGQNFSQPHAIVLSSANPREGKTTVVSNLGIALAQSKKRVLLVDGDTRRPRLHEIFGADNRTGLCDALSSGTRPSIFQTQIPNLFLLPSGHSDDAHLLFKPELPALLARLKAEFDMILIDAPPMLQMPDARIFGRHADAVVLVVAQHTSRDAVHMACQRLAEDGSLLLGTILNNWNPKHSAVYRDYYNSYPRQTARPS